MAYKIFVSPRAQKEIENAINYYLSFSSDAPRLFVEALEEAYQTLQSVPYFRIVYQSIRTFKLRRFPYSLYFVINVKENKVSILSCFHNKRRPKDRPKK
jgi:toxin ParE1/3/4